MDISEVSSEYSLDEIPPCYESNEDLEVNLDNIEVKVALEVTSDATEIACELFNLVKNMPVENDDGTPRMTTHSYIEEESSEVILIDKFEIIEDPPKSSEELITFEEVKFEEMVSEESIPEPETDNEYQVSIFSEELGFATKRSLNAKDNIKMLTQK